MTAVWRVGGDQQSGADDVGDLRRADQHLAGVIRAQRGDRLGGAEHRRTTDGVRTLDAALREFGEKLVFGDNDRGVGRRNSPVAC